MQGRALNSPVRSTGLVPRAPSREVQMEDEEDAATSSAESCVSVPDRIDDSALGNHGGSIHSPASGRKEKNLRVVDVKQGRPAGRNPAKVAEEWERNDGTVQWTKRSG